MTQNIDVSGILDSIPKKAKRSANTVKFGMFGLSLGKTTYNRLEEYCKKHNNWYWLPEECIDCEHH